MSSSVHSPCSGKVMALTDVPDPVFSQSLLGPGVAVKPDSDGNVYCPISGTVVKVMPHAFIINGAGENPANILVHLGLETVHGKGDYFEPLLAKGQQVETGDLAVRWHPQDLVADGINNVVIVVAVGAENIYEAVAADILVSPGEVIFTL